MEIGTSQTIILAYSIFKESQKFLVAGVPAFELKKGIDIAVEYIVENLTKIAKSIKTIEEIEQISTISANNDKIIR